MEKANITLIAAILAALTSTGNVYFSYLSNFSIEKEKRENARENEKRENLRKAIESFSEELSRGIWQSNWLLWYAAHDASRFSDKNISNYDKEMAKILPRLLTTRVLVAAHDMNVYEELTVLANRFYALDVSIAKASVQFHSSRDHGLEQLSQLYNEANAFHAQLGHKLAELYSSNAAKVIR